MKEHTTDTVKPEEYMRLLYDIDDCTDEKDVEILLKIRKSIKYIKIY